MLAKVLWKRAHEVLLVMPDGLARRAARRAPRDDDDSHSSKKESHESILPALRYIIFG